MLLRTSTIHAVIFQVVPNSESPFPETPDLLLPELIGTSEIMTDEHRRQVNRYTFRVYVTELINHRTISYIHFVSMLLLVE